MGFSNATAKEWKEARDNWRKFIVGDEDNDLSNEYVRKSIEATDRACEEAWKNLHKDTKILALFGTQPCKTSGNMTRTQFRPLESIAKAYGTFGSKYYHNEKLRDDILFALDWLYENLYGQAEIEGRGWRDTQDCDWWDWYVGSLHPLAHTLLIMEGYVSKENVKQYLSLYNHLRSTKMETTAVSPASRSYGGTLAALLEEDAERMEALTKDYDLMLEINNTSPNGIREDWCYRGHTYLAYTTLYGAATILERLVVLKYILNGTRFEINSSLSRNLCRCIYETFNPMLFGGVATMAQRGRHRDNEIAPTVEIVRGMLRCVGAFEKEDDVRIKSMIKRNVNDFNRDKIFAGLNVGEMEMFANILDDDSVKPEQIKRSKIYYTGDSVMHHMDNDRGFALQMSSTRIAGWESIDEENGNGWYLGDGFLYMYVKGREGSYSSSYWKNVNMYHLPGTTVDTQKRINTNIADNAKALMENDFAGACGIYGQFATAAMQLISWRNDVEEELSNEGYGGGAPLRKCTLEAKKAWFMFDDEVVALGTDIHAEDGFEVRTIVENRLLKGGEKLSLGEEVIECTDEFQRQLSELSYLHLENVAGIVFPAGGNLNVKKVKNNEEFLEVWFSHGVNPKDGEYAYIILPGKTAKETAQYENNPNIKILENNNKIQAVRKEKLGCTGIVFWESGNFECITAATSMIVMTGEKANGEFTLSVCDPTQLLKESAIMVKGCFYVLEKDERLSAVSTGESMVVNIDFDGSLGRSLEIKLKRGEDSSEKEY